MEGPPASQAPGRLPVEVDRSGDILVRAPGCLVAFVAFVLLLSLPDILDRIDGLEVLQDRFENQPGQTLADFLALMAAEDRASGARRD